MKRRIEAADPRLGAGPPRSRSRPATAASATSSSSSSSCSSSTAAASPRSATPTRSWPSPAWSRSAACRPRSGGSWRTPTGSSAGWSTASRSCSTARPTRCPATRRSSGPWRSAWDTPRPAVGGPRPGRPSGSWPTTTPRPSGTARSSTTSCTTPSPATTRADPAVDLVLDPEPGPGLIASVLGRYPFRDVHGLREPDGPGPRGLRVPLAGPLPPLPRRDRTPGCWRPSARTPDPDMAR